MVGWGSVGIGMIKKASSRWHLDEIWKEGELEMRARDSIPGSPYAVLKWEHRVWELQDQNQLEDICNEGTGISGTGD